MKYDNGVEREGSLYRYDNPIPQAEVEKINPDNSVVKALQDAGGVVEVSGEGVKVLGTIEYNAGRDRIESGTVGQDVLKTARTKSGLPAGPNPSGDDRVTINGVETSVENAQRMGLLATDVGGRAIEASPAQVKYNNDLPKRTKKTQPVIQNESFMDSNGQSVVKVMRDAVGSEATDATFYRSMAHLSSETVSGVDDDADFQENGAIETFQRETGATKEQAQKILKATLNSAYLNGVEYLAKKMGTKPEVVAKWLDNDPKSREIAYRSFYTGDRHNLNQMAYQMSYSPKFRKYEDEG